LATTKRTPPIPKKIKVGNKAYSVEIVETMRRKAEMGRVFYGDKKIELATHSNTCGRRFDPDEINVTFWHELVHAILYEMGSPLFHNERFVTQFANRLSEAIRTAKF
jgi:hypothetical protein